MRAPTAYGGQAGIVRQRQEVEQQPPQRDAVPVAIANVTNSNVTLYTVDSGRTFNLVQLDVCNIAGAALAVTVYLVPDGGSAANTNKIYDGHSIAANTSETLSVAHGLHPGGTQIIAVTDHATGGNFRLWGYSVESGDASP